MNFKALALSLGATLALSAPAFASESGTSTTVSNVQSAGSLYQVTNEIQRINGVQIDVSESHSKSQSGGTIVPGQPGGAGGPGYGACAGSWLFVICAGGAGGNGGNASPAQYLGGTTSGSSSWSSKLTNFSSVSTMSQVFNGRQSSNSTTTSVASFSNF